MGKLTIEQAMNTPLAASAAKRFGDEAGRHYVESILNSGIEQGHWFAPTNKPSPLPVRSLVTQTMFDIFSHLYHECHAVCRATIPYHRNGSWQGERILFMYRWDMDYKNSYHTGYSTFIQSVHGDGATNENIL
jgi:hypothetical protein